MDLYENLFEQYVSELRAAHSEALTCQTGGHPLKGPCQENELPHYKKMILLFKGYCSDSAPFASELPIPFRTHYFSLNVSVFTAPVTHQD